MEFGLRWIHVARYGVILRLDGALWLRIISGPPKSLGALHGGEEVSLGPRAQKASYI